MQKYINDPRFAAGLLVLAGYNLGYYLPAELRVRRYESTSPCGVHYFIEYRHYVGATIMRLGRDRDCSCHGDAAVQKCGTEHENWVTETDKAENQAFLFRFGNNPTIVLSPTRYMILRATSPDFKNLSAGQTLAPNSERSNGKESADIASPRPNQDDSKHAANTSMQAERPRKRFVDLLVFLADETGGPVMAEAFKRELLPHLKFRPNAFNEMPEEEWQAATKQARAQLPAFLAYLLQFNQGKS